MAQLDPRLLLQAAMSAQPGAATGAPTGTTPQMGAPTDALPAAGAAAAPPGAGGAADVTGQSGAPSNAQLAGIVGSGTDLTQDPEGIQQMVAMLQDPSTPPDQRAQIQMRLQLAALGSIAGGPSGAVGAPS